MASNPIPRVTEQEYLALDRASDHKSEFVGGEMFAMAGGTSNHSRLQGDFYTELNIRFRDGACEAFGPEMRVRVEQTRMYAYPDIIVVCGRPQFLDAVEDTLLNPVVLVEILSPSTEAYDRGRKFQHYQAIPSLEEYIRVSQEQVRIERFTRSQSGSGTWTLHTYSSLDQDLPIEAAGVAVPLQAIYRRMAAANLEH